LLWEWNVSNPNFPSWVKYIYYSPMGYVSTIHNELKLLLTNSKVTTH